MNELHWKSFAKVCIFWVQHLFALNKFAVIVNFVNDSAVILVQRGLAHLSAISHFSFGNLPLSFFNPYKFGH